MILIDNPRGRAENLSGKQNQCLRVTTFLDVDLTVTKKGATSGF